MSIKSIVENPHPIYRDNLDYWNFLLQSYEGGKSYTLADINDSGRDGLIRVNGKDFELRNRHNLFQHKKERSDDYKLRIEMSYYYNFCAPIIDIYTNHLLHDEPVIEFGNLEPFVETRIANVDLMDSSINEFRRFVNESAQIFGHVFVLTDMPMSRGEVSLAERIVNDRFPYFKVIYPMDVINWSLDRFGRLNWVVIRETLDANVDPDNFDPKKCESVFYKLWTRQEWRMYDKDYNMIDSGNHNLGRVPLDIVFDKKSKKERNLLGISTLADVAFIARDVYNKCSELNEILRNQTFAILAIQGNASDYNESEVGTNIAIVYNEGMNAPQYVSPPSDNAQVLMDHIDRQVKKMYQIAKLEGGDAESAGDVQSGISKAYDFHETNSALAKKASNMEDGEYRIWRTFGVWEGVDWDGKVTYSRDFNVKSLAEDLDESERLMRQQLGQDIEKKIKISLVKKKFPRMNEEEIEESVQTGNMSIGQRLRDRIPQAFTQPSGTNGGLNAGRN
jgi:hypothetical protein